MNRLLLLFSNTMCKVSRFKYTPCGLIARHIQQGKWKMENVFAVAEVLGESKCVMKYHNNICLIWITNVLFVIYLFIWEKHCNNV